MTDIDDRIRDVLDEDDRAFLDSLDNNRGMFRQIGDVMGGPLGGWAKLMAGVSIPLGIAMIVLLYQAITATELRETVLWSTAVLAALIAQGFLKEWFFNRMNMLSVLREVKRLQWQVAQPSCKAIVCKTTWLAGGLPSNGRFVPASGF